ncbi:MAG TPA: aldo/keto reductase [Ferruginibacter sp.]|jgi:aryl-alcohol dehydrogenase-like predicted oxidoreductase|nr:aldo/keto reductase [Ferruginibacter sp.]
MNARSKMGFGCVGLSAQPFESGALKLLEVAYNEGIIHFDTAPLYGKGYSEKILGRFLKGKRDKVTVTTKFGLPGGASKNIPAWLALPLNQLKKIKKGKSSVKGQFQLPGLLSHRQIGIDLVRTGFEKSLHNLQTDYIDYYLLHEALPSFLTEEALLYVVELKKKGLIKRIGIAASYPNLKNIGPATIRDWDILQYENSLLHPSENLLDSFIDKKHFYHSVLKPLAYKEISTELKDKAAGILLARAVQMNREGIILFSSSRNNNIKTNLQNLDAYSKYSVEELNNILSNAIH